MKMKKGQKEKKLYGGTIIWKVFNKHRRGGREIVASCFTPKYFVCYHINSDGKHINKAVGG
jgi:hypothetical protein